MNFFKRRRKQTVELSVSSDLNSDKFSEGKRVREPVVGFILDTYPDSETKVFEEAPLKENGRALIPSTSSQQNHEKGFSSNEVSNPPIITPQTENDELLPNGSITLPVPQPGSVVDNISNNVEDPTQVNEKLQQLMMLYASIIKGEKNETKKILAACPEIIEAPDNFGRTPLMYCVLSDRIDCAKLLLKLKCNLDQVDKAERSAIHLAAHKASYKFLELLHQRGGCIETKDKDGQTPLHLSTRNGNAKCLEFLLKRLSPGMVDVNDNLNRTALHWSAAFSNAEFVKLLIKYNSNVAMPDSEGKTPLHWAANSHATSAVATMKVLLDSSPSILNWPDREGRTALHYAVAHENVPAVQYLLGFEPETCEVDRLDNSYRTPLHWAAQLGSTEIVKLLLAVGAKNSVSDSNGATPLLYASLSNNAGILVEMVKNDRSVLEQSDIDGRNALMWAAGKGANEVIETLLNLEQPLGVSENQTRSSVRFKHSYVVDVNRTDNKGNTALHMASYNGHGQSADLLLTFKSRHDLQNNMNHTPLFGACEKGHLEVVKNLLDYNASISLIDLEKRSPLHWAALGGHADVCDFLIKKGLDPDIRDGYNRSPLHCAAFGGFINCMNLLLENKANVDLQDFEGMSALHWSAHSGHLDATKLLFQCSAFPNLMEFTEERLTPLDHALLHERDEVAQYLIEQGALSSETIRDIAAARIQACYRGYLVRKHFLKRKSLLFKHEALKNKNKKEKTRGKHKHLMVGEEFVPNSPYNDSIFADSAYSGDDASRQDTLEVESPLRTIKSKVMTLDESGSTQPHVEGSNEDGVKEFEKNEDGFSFSATKIIVTEANNNDNNNDENNNNATESGIFENESKENLDENNLETLRNSDNNLEALENANNNSETLENTNNNSEALENANNNSETLKNANNTSETLENTNNNEKIMENANSNPETLENTNNNSETLENVNNNPETLGNTNNSSEILENEDNNSETVENATNNNPKTVENNCEIIDDDNNNTNDNSLVTNVAENQNHYESEIKVFVKSKSDRAFSSHENIGTDSSKTEESYRIRQKSDRNSEDLGEEILPVPSLTQPGVQSSSGMYPHTTDDVIRDDVINRKSEKKRKKKKLRKPAEKTHFSTESDDPKSLKKNKTPRSDTNSRSNLTAPTREGKIEQNNVSSPENNQKMEPEKSKIGNASEKDSKNNENFENRNNEIIFVPAGQDFNLDINSIGRDEDIKFTSVHGTAYRNEDKVNDGQIFADSSPTHQSSDLPISEYIESLMNLSAPERKVLETLQRNRKLAFKRVSNASVVIQRAWWRFYKKKYPAKYKQRCLKFLKPTPSESPRQPTKPTPNNMQSLPRSAAQTFHNSPQSAANHNLPSTSKVKHSRQMKLRPQTTSGHLGRDPMLERSIELTTVQSNECDLYERRTKKQRPKTEQNSRRRPKLIVSSHNLTDERIDDLIKIYGKSMAIFSEGRSTLKSRPATSVHRPSTFVRPRQSRVSRESLEFVGQEEPVTEVEYLAMGGEWKSASAKPKNPKRKSAKIKSSEKNPSRKNYKFYETGVHKMPLQWQKMYSDLRGSSQFNSTGPSRYSYNMGNY